MIHRAGVTGMTSTAMAVPVFANSNRFFEMSFVYFIIVVDVLIDFPRTLLPRVSPLFEETVKTVSLVQCGMQLLG